MPEREVATELGRVREAMQLLERRVLELRLADILVGDFGRPWSDVRKAERNYFAAVHGLYRAVDALPLSAKPDGWGLDGAA